MYISIYRKKVAEDELKVESLAHSVSPLWNGTPASIDLLSGRTIS